MSTKAEDRKMPDAVYAAAGAGDLAYQQLRKLPEKLAELRGRVMEMRPVVADAVSEKSIRADVEKLRKAARRNANAVVNGAQAAQERAMQVYTELVAHGERVVAGARAGAAKLQLATARQETRDARETEAALGAEKDSDAESDLPSVPDKTVKRARRVPPGPAGTAK